jgi:hypothetical protein
MLGTVIHRFRELGTYRGVALRRGETEATFTLKVTNESAASQVNIDLAGLAPASPDTVGSSCCRPSEGGSQFTVSPQGYAVFHVGHGEGGYAVHLGRSEKGPQPKDFDSRELKPGDLFSAVVIRPGTYSVTNDKTGRKAELVVSYPMGRGEERYRPPAPLQIVVTEKGFSQGRIEAKPAQAQVYRIETPARIKIELVKPDDGPGAKKE